VVWSTTGVRNGNVEAGEEFGFCCERFGAKFGTFRGVQVELVAVDDESDPAEHTRDHGGKIAEFHRAWMGFEVVVAFGETVDGFAGGGSFTVELGEEVVLEDHGFSLVVLSWG